MRGCDTSILVNPSILVWPVGRLGGDPGAIRTRDPQIRNLVLYPAELRDHAYSLTKF